MGAPSMRILIISFLLIYGTSTAGEYHSTTIGDICQEHRTWVIHYFDEQILLQKEIDRIEETNSIPSGKLRINFRQASDSYDYHTDKYHKLSCQNVLHKPPSV